MSHMNLEFSNLLPPKTIIPVMVINNLAEAVPMAKKMIAKGHMVLEITLRSPCALAAVKEIIQHVPEAIVGVGTVLTEEQLLQSHQAGAKFAVSPGATDVLLEAADKIKIPLLPGVATASEAMKLQEKGYRYLKLFPAESAGGRALLNSLRGPLPDLYFCPTGGITALLAVEYLKLENVTAVGGSWMIEN